MATWLEHRSKNFEANGTRFRNNELASIKEISGEKITLTDGRMLLANKLHLDQGICVTSHASQGKTVDKVIVSCPVEAFSQCNEAQFYVSMSRARRSINLFTDSKVALREAIARTSQRISALELLAKFTAPIRHSVGRVIHPEREREAVMTRE